MKGNNGKKLENLVTIIEGLLLPRGFTVETRKPLYSPNGKQIAEFDIVINGNLGTTQISLLIECRDRPSEGPASSDWIEQLAGRKRRFNFHNVMAVSSTGFNKNAIDYALKEGIDLRSIDALSENEIKNWLSFQLSLVKRKAIFSSVVVHVEGLANLKDGTTFQIDTNNKTCVELKSKRTISIKELWNIVANNASLWDDIKEDGGEKEKRVNALDFLKDKYQIKINDNLHSIQSIEFQALFQSNVSKISLLDIGKYCSVEDSIESKKKFVEYGHWEAKTNDFTAEIYLIKFNGSHK